jgi:hypothetical protein
MVQRISQENQGKTNGVNDTTTSYVGSAPEHGMAFDIKDVADIFVPKVSPAEVTVKESNGKRCSRMTWSLLEISLANNSFCRRRWFQN